MCFARVLLVLGQFVMGEFGLVVVSFGVAYLVSLGRVLLWLVWEGFAV